MTSQVAPSRQAKPTIGTIVPGYLVPVINERAVRAAAGILFLLGAAAFATTLFTGSTQPMKAFGMLFLFDMMLRLIVGDRWSPTMALGRLAVRRQQPEWVGASQKEFAWWLGFALAAVSCASMGLLATPLWVTLSLCGLCLGLLFIETAFGICVGCLLQSRFGKQRPLYCPGGTCGVDSPTHRAHQHDRTPQH